MSSDKGRMPTERERIRELRESLGLRRTEFGARIGYTYQQIIRIEDGTSPVSSDMRKKISQEYRVSEEWLLGMEEGEIPQTETSEQRRERVRAVYKGSGMSQREFSRKTGTSVSMLNKVMTGEKQLTIRYARKLEEALGVGVDWILYGDEEAREYPCGETMIRYIKKHPDIRKEIWERMNAEKEAGVNGDAPSG